MMPEIPRAACCQQMCCAADGSVPFGAQAEGMQGSRWGRRLLEWCTDTGSTLKSPPTLVSNKRIRLYLKLWFFFSSRESPTLHLYLI